MSDNQYRTVQIRAEDKKLLVDYCEAMNHNIGEFVGRLIRANCQLRRRPTSGVLRVEPPPKDSTSQ